MKRQYITGVLVRVTDTHLYLADSTNVDSISWTHGNRDKSIQMLDDGMRIHIGDVIVVDTQRSTVIRKVS